MSLSNAKVWVAGAVALCLVLTLAGWFLLIGPKRAAAAETREQTAATTASNAQLEVRIAELEAQFAELPQRQAELALVKTAMPEDAQLPTLMRSLVTKAADSGVVLISMSPAPPVVLSGPGVLAPTDPALDTTTSAPAGGAAEPAAPLVPTDTLAAIPVTIVVVGNFFNAETFLKGVQTELSRDFLVQSLTIASEVAAEASGGKPAVKNGDVTMTLTGSVFVLRPASAAGIVPTDPAATSPSTDS